MNHVFTFDRQPRCPYYSPSHQTIKNGKSEPQWSTTGSLARDEWEAAVEDEKEKKKKDVSPALSLCCFSQQGKDTVRKKKRDKTAFDRHTPRRRSPRRKKKQTRRHHNMNNLWVWQPTRLAGINTATSPCSSVIFSNYLLGAHAVASTR